MMYLELIVAAVLAYFVLVAVLLLAGRALYKKYSIPFDGSIEEFDIKGSRK